MSPSFPAQHCFLDRRALIGRVKPPGCVPISGSVSCLRVLYRWWGIFRKTAIQVGLRTHMAVGVPGLAEVVVTAAVAAAAAARSSTNRNGSSCFSVILRLDSCLSLRRQVCERSIIGLPTTTTTTSFACLLLLLFHQNKQCHHLRKCFDSLCIKLIFRLSPRASTLLPASDESVGKK